VRELGWVHGEEFRLRLLHNIFRMPSLNQEIKYNRVIIAAIPYDAMLYKLKCYAHK